ncbi:capping complex subunit for YIEGIA [Aneurinibacillus sp. REN35]|uniref:capping complex subunit for YIEGIA n=1 Tax=Aneurinibacillus sp. REN35 TaxID=3237286 RepID=UPI003528408B
MSVSLEKFILAIVTTNEGSIGGGAPVFYAQGEKELQQIAFTLEKILDGIAHEVMPGTIILVKHS